MSPVFSIVVRSPDGALRSLRTGTAEPGDQGVAERFPAFRWRCRRATRCRPADTPAALSRRRRAVDLGVHHICGPGAVAAMDAEISTKLTRWQELATITERHLERHLG